MAALDISSHAGTLARVALAVDGPVLELGAGHYSTPLLHWLCEGRRTLVTRESHPAWLAFARAFESPSHTILPVADWETADLRGPWGVAFVDHDPASRRSIEIARLRHEARAIVVHDAQAFGLPEALATFRWAWHAPTTPRTSVVSDVFDVEALARWLT